jgi:hypothetical protein
LRAVTLSPSGALKELIDPTSNLYLKITIAGELQAFVMRSGSYRARIVRLNLLYVGHETLVVAVSRN